MRKRALAAILVSIVILSQLCMSNVLAVELESEAISSITSVSTYGAKGDGLTDDTNAIQSALNANSDVYIPDGLYMINVDNPLNLKSNQTLLMSENAVLRAIASSKDNSSVINIENVTNVCVSGGTIVGDRYTHLGASGERGMGIQIQYNSSNVTIRDVHISNCWGDGLYIGSPTGTSTTVTNILIEDVSCDNNRRQGMSITNATNITIKNSVFNNTNGIGPQAGINIEPNSGQVTSYIDIINTECTGNNGIGILLSGYLERISNISIIDCYCSDNGTGIYAYNSKNIHISGGNISSNEYGFQLERDVANITLTNVVIEANRSYGIAIVGSSQTTGIENVTIQGCSILNTKYIGAFVDNDDSSGYVRNIAFKCCSFIDNQIIKTQKYGLYMPSAANVSNVTLSKDNVFSGNTSGTYKGNIRGTRY